MDSRRRRIGSLGVGVLMTVLMPALAATNAGAFASGPAAVAARGHDGAPVRLKLATSSDAQALSAGKLRVVARTSHRRTVTFSTNAFQDGPRLTKPRTRSLNAGRNAFGLRLSAAGREVLAGCGAERLAVHASKANEGHTQLARATKAIDGTVPQCAELAHASRCETIADPGTNCLFPWPSDHLTVRDSSTGSGRRVDLSPKSMPTNKSGVPVDPTELNRSDGFSPGVSIVTRVPGMDTPQAFRRTGAVPLTDMSQAFRPKQPIVLIDAKTGKRQLIWTELDANATSPENTDFIIRVGKNLKEGHRYIVAMRGLKDSSGKTIPAPPGFALYRDRLKTDVPKIERRRRHFDSIFRTLKKAGIHRGNLYDAWDFTVASTRNITGRMLHIRDDGLRQLGDRTPGDGIEQGHAPSFTVTDVKTVNEPNPRPGHEDLKQTDPDHAVQNVREVTGTFQVPCYLDQMGCPSGSSFNLGAERAAAADARQYLYGELHLQHPALSRAADDPGVRRLARSPSRPDIDVRARAVRRRQ